MSSYEYSAFHVEILILDVFLAKVWWGGQPATLGNQPAHTGIFPVTKIRLLSCPNMYILLPYMAGEGGGGGSSSSLNTKMYVMCVF